MVKLANTAVDEVRRRVQNETTGGRGTKGDRLYRTRRLLLAAAERVTDQGKDKLRGLLSAGDPRGEVRDAWHAKENLRMIYRIGSRQLPTDTLDELARDLQDDTYSPELNKPRPNPGTLAHPDHELASLTRHERTDRGRQQSREADQARVVRDHQLRPSPNPRPAVRQKA